MNNVILNKQVTRELALGVTLKISLREVLFQGRL